MTSLDTGGEHAAQNDAAIVATVAVCTRGRADTLRDCLRSLLTQRYPGHLYEIIVVDDGSTDDTAAVVDALVSDRPPRLRYLYQHSEGLSAARNRAIHEARGDLICFTDDDVVAEPSWLGALVAGAQRHPDAECFGGRVSARLEGRTPRTCGKEIFVPDFERGPAERVVEFALGANMAIRRSTFERIGLFKPALVARGDEENWQHRLNQDGGRTVYLPDALVWHRRLASQLTRQSILRTRFAWGIAQIHFKRETGIRFDIGSELKFLVWHLLHAVHHFCFGGIMEATTRAGAFWAFMSGALRRPVSQTPRIGPRVEADRPDTLA